MELLQQDFSISENLFAKTRDQTIEAEYPEELGRPKVGIRSHQACSIDSLVNEVTKEIVKAMEAKDLPTFGFRVAPRGEFAQKYLEVQIISSPAQLLNFAPESAIEVFAKPADDLRLEYLMFPEARRITRIIHEILWSFNRDLAKGEQDVFGKYGSIFFKSSVCFSPRLIRRWALSHSRQAALKN